MVSSRARSPGLTARASSRVRALRVAASWLTARRPGPLWMTALWNRPLAAGMACSMETLAAAAALAEDGDIGRVAAESGDVVAHPFQHQHQIEHARRCPTSGSAAELGEVA